MDINKAADLALKLMKRREEVIRIIGQESYDKKISLYKDLVRAEMKMMMIPAFEAAATLSQSADFLDVSAVTRSMLICAALEIIENE